jgi:hypothetical protein
MIEVGYPSYPEQEETQIAGIFAKFVPNEPVAVAISE